VSLGGMNEGEDWMPYHFSSYVSILEAHALHPKDEERVFQSVDDAQLPVPYLQGVYKPRPPVGDEDAGFCPWPLLVDLDEEHPLIAGDEYIYVVHLSADLSLDWESPTTVSVLAAILSTSRSLGAISLTKL